VGRRFLLSFLPKGPTRRRTVRADQAAANSAGHYDVYDLGQMAGIGFGAAAVVALFGMIGFSRSDV